jgi:predicted RNase H-like HicB family nuclease
MESCANAREAYEAALVASAEIRQVLDSQGDTLESLMSKLQETITLHTVRKGETPSPLEAQVEENVHALIRQLKESEPDNGKSEPDNGKKDETTTVSASPKKKIWQL